MKDKKDKQTLDMFRDEDIEEMQLRKKYLSVTATQRELFPSERRQLRLIATELRRLNHAENN